MPVMTKITQVKSLPWSLDHSQCFTNQGSYSTDNLWTGCRLSGLQCQYPWRKFISFIFLFKDLSLPICAMEGQFCLLKRPRLWGQTCTRRPALPLNWAVWPWALTSEGSSHRLLNPVCVLDLVSIREEWRPACGRLHYHWEWIQEKKW